MQHLLAAYEECLAPVLAAVALDHVGCSQAGVVADLL